MLLAHTHLTMMMTGWLSQSCRAVTYLIYFVVEILKNVFFSANKASSGEQVIDVDACPSPKPFFRKQTIAL